jgi:predicted nucleic acid-binding Zn ribbon protein
VDDIKNKEILSRKFFTVQGKGYCLVKLYSLAQAMNGARIAGSIYGVGLISDRAIDFSKENLDLLRAAKDNFAKLSLDGLKFNKSNFKSDTDKIWENLTLGPNGNLLDKVSTFDLVVNGSQGQTVFFAKNLFGDAIKLNQRILKKDTVYLSEDLDHLKRTQQKWGKDQFPIYHEENGEFVPYKEGARVVPPNPQPTVPGTRLNVSTGGDESKLRSALDDAHYANKCLEEDLARLKQKQKRTALIVYGLSALVFILFLLLFFFEKIFLSEDPPQPAPVALENPIDQIWQDSASRMEMVDFIENISFIYYLDNRGAEVDTITLIEKYQEIAAFSSQFNFDIKNVREKFLEQKKKISSQVSPDKDTTNANSGAEND